jgi:hypothetical protein
MARLRGTIAEKVALSTEFVATSAALIAGSWECLTRSRRLLEASKPRYP